MCISNPLVRLVGTEKMYVSRCTAAMRSLILPYTYSYCVLEGPGPFRWKRAYVPRSADITGIHVRWNSSAMENREQLDRLESR